MLHGVQLDNNERIWKEAIMRVAVYCPDIHLERLGRTTVGPRIAGEFRAGHLQNTLLHQFDRQGGSHTEETVFHEIGFTTPESVV
jgi:hypothetical protein